MFYYLLGEKQEKVKEEYSLYSIKKFVKDET